jgi:hypothetical protein
MCFLYSDGTSLRLSHPTLISATKTNLYEIFPKLKWGGAENMDFFRFFPSFLVAFEKEVNIILAKPSN